MTPEDIGHLDASVHGLPRGSYVSRGLLMVESSFRLTCR